MDGPEEIQKKVKMALTDSEPTISYDPVNRPGVSNLIELMGHFDGDRSCDDIVAEYGSLNLRAFKELLGSKISSKLEPVRERYLELTNDNTGCLDSIAEQGAQKANQNACLTLDLVKGKIGL